MRLPACLILFWFSTALSAGPMEPGDPKRPDRKMNDTYITYSRTLPTGGELFLVLNPNADSQLTITSDPAELPFAGRVEIGVYRHRIPATEVDSLKTLLKQAVREMPRVADAVPMGTPLLFFAIGNEAVLDPSATFPLTQPLPPDTKRFDDQMLELAAKLIQHPFRTVKARADWQGPFDREQGLKVRLTVRNSGIVPVKIPNPAAAKEDDEVGLRLDVLEDLPAGEVTPDKRAGFAVKRTEVKQIAAPGAEPGDDPQAIVTLDLKEELVLEVTVRRHLYVGPGRYRGVLTFMCQHEKLDEKETAAGYLQVPLGPLAITSGARARKQP